VLVLDDALSSVDVETEREILTRLRPALGGRATLLISHRMSTISLVDQVVLMEHGRIVDTGTHTELMLDCPRYAEVLGQVTAAS